jgi:hypothetical protein
MKTTIEIADPVYRQVKARAALRGQTVKAFFLEAVRDKLSAERSKRIGPTGWRSVFGKASKTAVADLQHTLDEEFSRIDPDDWK